MNVRPVWIEERDDAVATEEGSWRRSSGTDGTRRPVPWETASGRGAADPPPIAKRQAPRKMRRCDRAWPRLSIDRLLDAPREEAAVQHPRSRPRRASTNGTQVPSRIRDYCPRMRNHDVHVELHEVKALQPPEQVIFAHRR